MTTSPHAAAATPPSVSPKPSRRPAPAPRRRAAPWLRPTIRIRLTLLYGGMFLMAGVVLLALIAFLAADTLKEGTPDFRIFGTDLRVSNVNCPILPMSGTVDEINKAISTCIQDQRSLALGQLLNRSMGLLLGLTIVAFAFGYAMAGRVLSPLGRITRTAQRVAGSDLHRRIELGGPDDELK
ncbi:HAMP domain-containing protein, partial [Streptomyces diastatochromogenes]|uniref:HAMP domain-containing protein n=1 Tax=Streptomyces diastatochromogenes TaxID=42236 RepID=UPI002F26DE6D